MPSVEKRISGAKTSKTAVRKKVTAELENDGIETRSFRSLPAKQQADYIGAAIRKNSAKAKQRAEVFARALNNMATDQNLYATAGGSASWAASVAKAEVALREFVREGYPSTTDSRGHQGIVVTSSHGFITVGAGAISHVSHDHPDENGRPGVTIRGIIEAIENPRWLTETRMDDNGLESYKAVGKSVTVVINPKTEEVVTAWNTLPKDLRSEGEMNGKKRRRRR